MRVTERKPDGTVVEYDVPDPPYERPQQAPVDAMLGTVQALLADMVAEGAVTQAKANAIINRFSQRK